MDKPSSYYLQFLFDKKAERDLLYGRELFIDVAQSNLRAGNDGSYEILYRRKGTHYTGARHWYGRKERKPTIEMVIDVPNERNLEHLLLDPKFRVGERRKVTKATLAFTTTDEDETRLNSFVDELKLQSTAQKLHTKFKVRSYVEDDDEGDKIYTDYLDGFASGPVRAILNLYNFTQGRGIKFSSIDLDFS